MDIVFYVSYRVYGHEKSVQGKQLPPAVMVMNSNSLKDRSPSFSLDTIMSRWSNFFLDLEDEVSWWWAAHGVWMMGSLHVNWLTRHSITETQLLIRLASVWCDNDGGSSFAFQVIIVWVVVYTRKSTDRLFMDPILRWWSLSPYYHSLMSLLEQQHQKSGQPRKKFQLYVTRIQAQAAHIYSHSIQFLSIPGSSRLLTVPSSAHGASSSVYVYECVSLSRKKTKMLTITIVGWCWTVTDTKKVFAQYVGWVLVKVCLSIPRVCFSFCACFSTPTQWLLFS